MKLWQILFIWLVFVAVPLKAQEYAIEELSDEGTWSIKPFSINRVEPFDGGLRIFINTEDPAAVADLVTAGTLQAQLSDHQAETQEVLPISLGKAVRCTSDADPVYLGYEEPNPACGGKQPASIEYFFSVAAVLGPNRDLAIGEDPDFMWLIEEQ
jgi:hypothetical protein